jgi:SET domain-containing protein
MNYKIESPTKIYVDKSPVHGWGVFAKEIITQGEIIEECPILTLPISPGEVTPLLIDYRFNWPSGTEWVEQVLSLGFGSLYNHSENPNAYWISDLDKKTFKFIATKRIEPNEEIFVWYGDENYWNDGRTNTKIIF